MREYKLLDAFEVVKNSFSFLSEEWGFEKTREDDINYGCYFKYLKNRLTIRIGYEYKDNCFYFDFIIDEQRFEYIKDEQRQLIFSFFKEREPNIEWKSFMPNDFQYKESLMHNVEYLKKYKDDILKMAE